MILRDIDTVIKYLDEGSVVALPTESSFALSCRADSERAVGDLLDIKEGREQPIGIMVGRHSSLDSYIHDVSNVAKLAMRRLWPGPVSILFAAAPTASKLLVRDTGAISVRLPAAQPLRVLLDQLPYPVTATSANLPGRGPACTMDEVKHVFPGLPIWGAMEQTPGGPASTLVDFRGDRCVILRPGAYDSGRIERWYEENRDRAVTGEHSGLD